MESLIDTFDIFIKDVASNIGSNKGILIVIDDINGLCQTPEFANWFRGIMHKLTFEYDGQIPIMFLLTSYPENLIRLQNHNESFGRLFYHYEISPLSNADVSLFFKEKFSQANMTCSDDIIELIVRCSYGIPLVMQEIGDNIYWLCDDSRHVNLNIALNGLRKASQIIYDRYLNSIISDENYLKLLQIISDNVDVTDLTSFDTNDILKELKEEEYVLLNTFVDEALENDIITKISHFEDNKYKFNNPLYMVYIKLENLFKN